MNTSNTKETFGLCSRVKQGLTYTIVTQVKFHFFILHLYFLTELIHSLFVHLILIYITEKICFKFQ